MKETENEIIWVEVNLSVSFLFQNKHPYTNFWMYCLLNDYIEKDGEDKYKTTIDIVHLAEDGTEEQIDYVWEMLQKYDIAVVPVVENGE